MPTPFDDKTLMNWFFTYLESAPCDQDFISTIGSFPVLEGDFDDLLRLGGLTPNYITKDTEVLIVGREEWNEEDLSKLLDMREGKSLKVYSQEMFMSYWALDKTRLKIRRFWKSSEKTIQLLNFSLIPVSIGRVYM